jgi:hypothetical protein
MSHIEKIERTLAGDGTIEDALNDLDKLPVSVREEMIACLGQLEIESHKQSDDDWLRWTWRDTIQAVVSDAFSLGRIIAIAATEILPDSLENRTERRLKKINYLRTKLQESLVKNS